jgi:NAD+--asparagine ADP-ribosyltransferase
MGFNLKQSSKDLVSEFNKKYKSIDLDAIKDKLILNIEDQNAFEKASLDFLKAIKLLKSIENEDDHDVDEPFDPPGQY